MHKPFSENPLIMRKNILTNILLIQALLLSGSGAFGSEGPPDVTIPGIEPVIHGDDDRFSIAASFSTSNRYVTEGIDNVPGSAFIFSEVVGDYKGLALGVWYAEALSDAYNELNVFTQYTLDLDPVEIFAGVNYLYYPSGADSKS